MYWCIKRPVLLEVCNIHNIYKTICEAANDFTQNSLKANKKAISNNVLSRKHIYFRSPQMSGWAEKTVFHYATQSHRSAS